MNQTSASGRGPALRPFVPGGAGRDLPVAQQLGRSAGGEDRGEGPDQRGDDLIARQAAVAVGELVRGGLPEAARRDHERRVGDHQFEFLARHRIQQGAPAQAHAGFQVGGVQVQLAGVEEQVEAGEREGAVGDVGGGDVLGVVEQVEGLDAAAGAEVQGPGHVPAGGDLHQRGGGLPDPEDVVVAQHPGALVGGEVAGHPELRAPLLPFLIRPVPAVGPQVHLRLDQAVGGRLHEAQFQQARRADAGQGGVEGGGGLRFGQQPEADDGGERRRRRLPVAGRLGNDQRGNQLVPAQGAVRGRAEQFGDAVNGVADAAQVRGQGIEQAGEVAARGVGGVAGREMR